MTDSATAKDISFADYQARERFISISRRYINIFHQLHVIEAGIAELNKDFMAMPAEAIELLPELSGGAKLRQHILNLKNGATPMDKIDPDLLPFGAEVFEDKARYEAYTGRKAEAPAASGPAAKPASAAAPAASSPKSTLPGNLESDNARVIFDLLRTYQNTPAELEKFKAREEVKDFGPEWKARISDMIDASDAPDKDGLRKIFDGLVTFDYALLIWHDCAAMVKNPKGVIRDELKAKLAEYKKYLSMFGQGGADMYARVEAIANGA